jgi:hypothetical protein
MRENRTYGSVRGAPSDGRPYRDPEGHFVSSSLLLDSMFQRDDLLGEYDFSDEKLQDSVGGMLWMVMTGPA